MDQPNPTQCPQCSGPLEVSAVRCPQCELTMTGEFGRCRFCALSPEHRDLLDAFLRSRGVIRQMEKELGISYPTVRSRLDDLLQALGYLAGDAPAETVRSILERIERGEIAADEGAQRIRTIRGGR